MKRALFWIVALVFAAGIFFVVYKGGFVSVYAEALSLWDDFRVSLTDKEELLQENIQLSERYERQVLKLQRYENLAKENERLRSLLDIKQNLDYDGVAARVISFGDNSGFKHLVADKGVEAGIVPGMCAVSRGGFVGVVSDCGQGWCTVETLYSKKLKLSVKCSQNGKTYLLNGGTPNLSFAGEYDGLSRGGLLFSSGLSSKIPGEIKVARINSLLETSSGEYEVAVEPVVNYGDTSYIFLLIL